MLKETKHPKKHEEDTSLIPLSEYIKQLQSTIKYSKVFIQSIIEHIRNKGKIKIINQSNNNPTHLNYLSSFPDLFTEINQPNNKQNDHYTLDKFDEKFDLEGRTKILGPDNNFKKRMDMSIQKSYYNDFSNERIWDVSDQLNTFDNIHFTIRKFQEKYEYLKLFNKFDESFMMDSNPFLFIINDHIIPINTCQKMMQDFKKIIPDIETQRLISTYANQNFLRQSYLQLASEHPEINQYQFINSKNTYTINYLNDGTIKLVATHISDLNTTNNNSTKPYKSCGIRATVIFSPNYPPIMKFSHFLEK